MSIFLAAAASGSPLVPPPVPSWLNTLNAAYPVGQINDTPGALLSVIVIGTLFTAQNGGQVTGIRHTVGLQNGPDPISITFKLWEISGVEIASETIPFVPSMYGTDLSTTVAFGSHAVLPNSQYIASVRYFANKSPYSQIVPPGYLPQSYQKYTVEVGAQVYVGTFVGGFPATNDPNYAVYVEPLFA